MIFIFVLKILCQKRIFLKNLYFSSEKINLGENLNIFEINIMSVEVVMILWFSLCLHMTLNIHVALPHAWDLKQDGETLRLFENAKNAKHLHHLKQRDFWLQVVVQGSRVL
jgi:ascorbate-specific PTS system EIIC-type component UlaA